MRNDTSSILAADAVAVGTSSQPARGGIPVSVLVPVKNEESNIKECLASVAWANEVIVVDSASTDRTLEIATETGARVEQFDYAPGGPRKKNWALQNLQFTNEWILIVDADERITPDLSREIAEAIANPQGHNGFYLNRRFNFLGAWIYHAGYFPSWNLRLFRLGCGLYENISYDTKNSGDNEVHEHVILNGTAGHLAAPMDHFAFPTITEFIDKHKRYANWEAELQEQAANLHDDGSGMARQVIRLRSLKRLARRFPFPHWLRFVYHYFFKKGYMDGVEGYIFCHLLAEYEFWISVRRFEIRKQRNQP